MGASDVPIANARIRDRTCLHPTSIPAESRLWLSYAAVATMAMLLTAGFSTFPTAAVCAFEPTTAERLLVIAPHPDDETIGAGGLIQRILRRGGSVRVVLVTAGDGYVEAVVQATGLPRPRPAQYVAYGEQRLREARAAVRGLGDGKVRLQTLGFPDGGLVSLLHAHWRRTHPEHSRTTGVAAPPYPEVLDPTVAYDGADLLRELRRVVSETRPTTVVFPHPLDRHPDHHATGLFTLLAIDEWAAEHGTSADRFPRLLAYLVHWPDWPPGWDAATPRPEATHAGLDLPPSFPVRDRARTTLMLSEGEVAAKGRALATYVSQQQVMASLLAAFVRQSEPFVCFTDSDRHETERIIRQSANSEHHAGQPPRSTTPSQ